MTIETIKMDAGAARLAYREYQAAVRANRGEIRQHWKDEDLALVRGYRELAKGRQIVNLNHVMKTAGLREDGYPRLAVCASHLDRVACLLNTTGAAHFGPLNGARRRGGWWNNRWLKHERIAFPEKTFPVQPGSPGSRSSLVSTLVPIVPPNLRPKTDIAKYVTLWEVESWTLEPPRDPILLRPLGGALYAVLAVWDLSELERAVLGLRANA